MSRNLYKFCDTIGFVQGGNIFATSITTQDENQSGANRFSSSHENCENKRFAPSKTDS